MASANISSSQRSHGGSIYHPAQALQQLIEQLNLHLNELEPVIICRICQFALSGSIKSIVDHIVDKHKCPRYLRKDLGQLLKPYTILGPKELRLRLDYAPPHLHLSKHLDACDLLTSTSRQNLLIR